MQKPNKSFLLSLVLFAISVAFFTLAGLEIAKRYSNPQVIYAKPALNSVEKEQLAPITLKIESAKINVPIMSSHKIWEEKAKSAVYFSKTPLPGQNGNSVIYGHNWPNLLGELNKAKVGDIVEIGLSNGNAENFRIVQKINVTADQTHILNQTADSRLTIYTCSGILDTKRLVVVATKTNKL